MNASPSRNQLFLYVRQKDFYPGEKPAAGRVSPAGAASFTGPTRYEARPRPSGKPRETRGEKAAVPDGGLPSVLMPPGQLSNSPSFTPPTKASHSERVKNSFGPSGFLESRNT